MENEMNIVSDESKELANRLEDREMELLEKVSLIPLTCYLREMVSLIPLTNYLYLREIVSLIPLYK
jgi:hypothetical protein